MSEKLNINLVNVSLKVTRHKCFQDEPQGFESIKPINIVIGKNSSGKTALIDAIQQMAENSPNSNFDGMRLTCTFPYDESILRGSRDPQKVNNLLFEKQLYVEYSNSNQGKINSILLVQCFRVLLLLDQTFH